MEREVISHDVETGEAFIRFSHNDIVIEQNCNLKKIIPGSEYILSQMGIDYTEEHQLSSLDKYTQLIEAHINEGVITESTPGVWLGEEEPTPPNPTPEENEEEDLPPVVPE